MIEFYDNDMSVCAQKVRMVLAEKGLDYERHHLNLRAGDQFDPDYLKLNPKAVVPTLVHDGNVVIESTVIIHYLEDAFAEPSLSPAAAIDRAHMLRWMILPDAGLHDACGLTSFALAFRQQLAKLEPAALEAHYAKMPDENRRQHVRNVVEQGLDAPGVAGAIRSYARAIDAMGKVLGSADWLAGDECTLADITMLPYVLRLEHLGLDWLWAGQPGIAGWLDRMKARASYRVIEQHLDPKYLEIMPRAALEDGQRIRELVTA